METTRALKLSMDPNFGDEIISLINIKNTLIKEMGFLLFRTRIAQLTCMSLDLNALPTARFQFILRGSIPILSCSYITRLFLTDNVNFLSYTTVCAAHITLNS